MPLPKILISLTTTLVLTLGASQAHAIGLGFELGGGASYPELASNQLKSAPFYGGGPALVLQLGLMDEDLIKIALIGRAEVAGHASPLSGGLATLALAGGELLLRAGLKLPIVEPFLELGGGAGIGTGYANQEKGGARENYYGAMWAPAGYAGLGLTISVPLMPYFEVRLGSHIGGLMPVQGFAPDKLADPVFGSLAGYVGMGWRL